MHLVQTCKDRDLSYQEAATYLRIYGVELDEGDQEPKKTYQVEKEVEKKYLSYEETREVYVSMSEIDGPRRAFRVINNGPRLRKSLNIHNKIWKRLSEEIQNKIKKIRHKIREENNMKQENTITI